MVTSDRLVCCAWPGPSGVMWKLRERGSYHGNEVCSEEKPRCPPSLDGVYC